MNPELVESDVSVLVSDINMSLLSRMTSVALGMFRLERFILSRVDGMTSLSAATVLPPIDLAEEVLGITSWSGTLVLAVGVAVSVLEDTVSRFVG